jgi:putative transcriptional regulator
MALKQPTPAEILAAREKAGLTQTQAAELVHLAHRVRWTEYETGTHAIDLARWELFLVKTSRQRARKT